MQNQKSKLKEAPVNTIFTLSCILYLYLTTVILLLSFYQIHKNRYQPGCEEDLAFQITRLKEESERRQALIEEETLHIESLLKDATKTLKTCQGQVSGCEPEKEAHLRLSKKHISECVDVRKRHDHEVSWRMIYGCLWKYRGVKLIHDIETWFTVPTVDMKNGCNKIRPLDSDPSVVDVRQCLCEEWDAVTKLEDKAQEKLQKEHAAEEVEKATKEFQEKLQEDRKKENEEAQEKATEDIVYNELKKEGKLNSVLKDAKKEESTTATTTIQQTLEKAEKEVHKHTKCKQENGVACDDVKAGAGVDQSKLDYCMGMSDSDTVRTNIRKAFQVGSLKTGCALLSLATNAVLKNIHDCMCGGSASKAAMQKSQENQDNGAAISAVANQLSPPTKTLSDVPKRRFLRFKETKAQLVGQK